MNGLGFDRYTAKIIAKVRRAGGQLGSGTWVGWTTWNLSLFTTFLFGELHVRETPKQQAVYLFLGDNAECHKLDLFDNFPLLYIGTATHNYNGIAGVLSPSGYAYMPVTVNSLVNGSRDLNFSAFIKSNVAADQYDVGVYTNSGLTLISRNSGGSAFAHTMVPDAPNYLSAAVSSSVGYYQVLSFSTVQGFYKNGTIIAGASQSNSTPPSGYFSIGAAGGLGVGTRVIQFVHIAQGYVKSGNIATLNNWVPWFQATILNR